MGNAMFMNLMKQAQKLFKHNRQHSHKTRERYSEAYARFLRYLAEEFRLQKIANVSSKHLVAYVWNMQDDEKAASTIKTDLCGIRFWHDQIPQARYTLPGNETLDLERRTFGGKDRAWTQDEYEGLLRLARLGGWSGYAACFILAWEIGLRIHEIFRIDTATARDAIKRSAITIKGKGGKVRTIPLSDVAAQVLKECIKATPTGHKLFVPAGKQTHVAIKELQKFIRDHRDAIQRPGREVPLTMHGGRHAYAARTYQELVDSGVDEDSAKRTVSKRLGHERKDVTDIYLATRK